MKLIDLLVQELPKRGGWPEGVSEIGQDYDGELMFYGRGNVRTWIYLTLSSDHRNIYRRDGDKVTKDRYESALAASQKPEWNGEGVPPVGCECEYSLNGGVTWWKCKIDYIVGTQGVVMLCDTFEGVQYVKFSSYGGALKFRPIRTEADKKRERICDAIYGALTKAERQHNRSDEAEAVYDAIAVGKIPGVKLED